MKINVFKCCHIQFIKAKIHHINKTYYLYDTYIYTTPISDHCNYLGITIQSNLKWEKHIEEKIASASRVLGLLQRNIKTSAMHIRDLAYIALVKPNLEYASTVWSPRQRSYQCH